MPCGQVCANRQPARPRPRASSSARTSWANRWWISPDIGHFSTRSQQLFDHEGKRLVHVTTYVEGNQRRWIGISRSGDWANRWFLRSDLDLFGLEAQRLFDDEHLRLVHVEMLQ